jgi:hypothetical protein
MKNPVLILMLVAVGLAGAAAAVFIQMQCPAPSPAPIVIAPPVLPSPTYCEISEPAYRAVYKLQSDLDADVNRELYCQDLSAAMSVVDEWERETKILHKESRSLLIAALARHRLVESHRDGSELPHGGPPDIENQIKRAKAEAAETLDRCRKLMDQDK